MPLKKTQLSHKDIAGYISQYLTEGRKQESWEIVSIDIEGKILTARLRMKSRHVSATDPGGFHLTIFSTLEFLSQLLIIYAHVWAGLPSKTREGWMIESSIRSKSSVRDPENINVRMEVASIRKVKDNILAVTHSKVFDDNGSFEATLKGFFSMSGLAAKIPVKEAVDFSSPGFINDPYPTYERLRQTRRPYWLPHVQTNSTSEGVWLFFGYDEVASILRMSGPISKDLTRIRTPGAGSLMDAMMLNRDPPDHTRLRALANHAFTPKAVHALEPGIARIATSLATALAQKSSADFIADYATPLPILVLAELMGISPEDSQYFRDRSIDILNGHDSAVATKDMLGQQKNAMESLIEFFGEQIQSRRKTPREDLISSLVQAHDDGGKLSGAELMAMFILFLLAGHETTTNLLGSGTYTLLRHPDQLAMLRANPTLMASAVEELLRYESPVQRGTFRITTETCEIAGHRFAAGEQIGAVTGSANRDPASFDKPEIFDIARSPNRHMAFGLGIHFCLGAFLARAEARIGFEKLLEFAPNLRLANAKPEWKPATLFRGLHSLPVLI